ncbi:CsgG/HfaB family protein [Methylocaldum sp. 14B]|jgi:hypothetical protein|uniref:CsgG/HfaB family protein n=1 Tax=Methylocaldum sp. 14B TaxID=1912213 RepID=UPI000989F378|nr:CsgG/HfaB family protein [Methylocaldum sp. 14B]
MGKVLKSTTIAAIMMMALVVLVGCAAPRPTITVQGAPAPSFNPNAITKLAVVVAPIRQSPLRFVEDEIVAQLMRKGYSLATRSDMESILREMQFQHSGLTQADAARLGRLLNVPALLLVEVTHLSGVGNGFAGYQPPAAVLSARLVQVEQGEILWAASASYHSTPDAPMGSPSFYGNVQVNRPGFGFASVTPWMTPAAPGYPFRHNSGDGVEILRTLAMRIAEAFPPRTAVPSYSGDVTQK